MGYIYKITNNINNQLYIGQTRRTIEQRWQEHCKKASDSNRPNTRLYNAMFTLGTQNFIPEEIEQCEDELLDEREVYWIKYYDTYKNGYNMTMCGNTSYHKRYDYNIIINLIQQQLTLNDIIAQIGCSRSLINRIAQSNNLIIYKPLIIKQLTVKQQKEKTKCAKIEIKQQHIQLINNIIINLQQETNYF